MKIESFGVAKLVDAAYVRGWDDCLEAIETIIEKNENVGKVKAKIQELRVLVRENKFERIRYELGAFNIF